MYLKYFNKLKENIHALESLSLTKIQSLCFDIINKNQPLKNLPIELFKISLLIVFCEK